jgi:hypothetical protein
MFPFLYVFFGILIAFFVLVDVVAFALALLGFGEKKRDEQRNWMKRL